MSSNTHMQTLLEKGRETPIFGEYDVVVLGGGPSGIAAASAAARHQQKVLLIEAYGFLGGMGTAAGVTNFCGLHGNVFGEVRQVVHGVVDDLLGRMNQLGGLREPHTLFGGRTAAQAYDNAAFKVAADELVLASGAQILFHAKAVGAICSQPGRIDSLLMETKSGRYAVRAKNFIDCSGDGDLALHAGVPFEKGTKSGEMMYPSSMFRLNGVDAARAGDIYLHFEALMDEAETRGYRFSRRHPVIRPQKHSSEWRANVTQLANADGSPVDCTDAVQLSAAEVQGRRQITDFVRFLREMAPGFENSYLLEIAPQVGVRETRRFRGDYQLTEEDVLECASFDDSIGVNGWMIEDHVTGNIAFRWQKLGSRGFNHMPFRMLVASGVDNLMIAGRCGSMTHAAQASARVSGACFVMGQAAGTAAAIAGVAGTDIRKIDIGVLQAQLEQDGAYLGRDYD